MTEPTMDEFLGQFRPRVRELTLQTHQLILDSIQDIQVFVDSPSRIIAYGFGRRYSDLIFSIAPYTAYLNVIFARGTELPDPDLLLLGSGKHPRHVRIKAAEDIRRPGLVVLLKAARTMAIDPPKTFTISQKGKF